DKIKASIDGEPVEDVKDPVAADEPEELQADEEEPGDSGVAVEVAPLEGEDTDEEYDGELYDIFIQQLKENISFLQIQADQYGDSSIKQEILERCVDGVKSLKSSANYMGYDKLATHYSTWLEEIDSAIGTLNAGQDTSFDMQPFIDEIVRVYPQAIEEAEKEEEDEPLAALHESLFSPDDEAESKADSDENGFSSLDDDHENVDSALDSLFPGSDDSSEVLSDWFDDSEQEPAPALSDTDETLSVPPADQEVEYQPIPLENEAGDEDYDEELLSIFMEQLRTNIPLLEQQFSKFDASDDKQTELEKCSGLLKSLRSSANYMGYDLLADHYDGWQEAIDEGEKRLSAGEDVEFGAMRPYLDAVVRAYPLTEGDSSSPAEGDDSDLQSETDSGLGADDELQKSLEAALGSDMEDKAEIIDDDLNDKPAPLEDEASSEEYDEELLSIFMQQLQESVPLLRSQVEELATVADTKGGLNNCSDTIKLLKSSANYMGYEKLAGHYSAWQQNIDRSQNLLSEGREPRLAFMQNFLDEITRVYPVALEEVEGENGVEKDDEFEDITDTVGSLLSSFDDESTPPGGGETIEESVSETVEEASPPPADSDQADDELKLFDKLSYALDATLDQTENVPLKPMHGVIKEMITPPEKEVSKEDEPGRVTEPVAPAGADQKKKEEISPAPAATREAIVEQARDQDKKGVLPAGPAKEKKAKKETGPKKVRQSMRVDADKIDYLMNQVGELVVSRAYFAQLFNEVKGLQQGLAEGSGLSKAELKPLNEFAFRLGEAGVALGRVSNELQEGVMKVRMLPIDRLFKRFPRLVRDLVHKSDKKVDLQTQGEETELDKMVIEEISDPLIHIIRNAVDHGIETTEERKSLGKPETGTLKLEAFHESDHIVIDVTDDGKGLDEERVKAKALSMGLYSREELNRMSSLEVKHLIMQPGFSTAEKATKTSGRGVGMDVVKKNIEKLNGTVEIETKAGEGTRIRVKIPLTMAIIQALMVRVGSEKFTIPLTAVEETLRIFQNDISEIEGVDVIHLRNSTMPIFRLSKIFGVERVVSDKEKFFVVVVSTGLQELGLVVDELLGQEEVVIKPLADYLQLGSGFSGATILGNGGISLILDIPELVKMTTDKQISKQKNLSYKRRMLDIDDFDTMSPLSIQ
ncbi:MAG: chemotaxis protein CheA, partial [Thermodesulfobacteriota bacterium]